MLAMVGESIGDPAQGAGEEPGLRWACAPLDGPGHLVLALADRVTTVIHLLDHFAPV